MAHVGAESAIGLSNRALVAKEVANRRAAGGGVLDAWHDQESQHLVSDQDLNQQLGINHDDFDEFGESE